MAFRSLIAKLHTHSHPSNLSPPFRQTPIRHIQTSKCKILVIYDRKRSYWRRFRSHSFTVVAISVGALIVTGVERYNTVKTVPSIPSDIEKVKLRLENVWKTRPSTIAEKWKAWKSPIKPVSGTEKSFDEVKVMMGQNHELEMAEMANIKEEQRKLRAELEKKSEEEEKKKKRKGYFG